MEKKVSTQIKMEPALIARIKRAARAEASSFSQFVRTAAIEKMRRTGKAA